MQASISMVWMDYTPIIQGGVIYPMRCNGVPRGRLMPVAAKENAYKAAFSLSALP